MMVSVIQIRLIDETKNIILTIHKYHSISIYAILYSLVNIFFIISFSCTPITFSISMYILLNLTHLYKYINCYCYITCTNIGNTLCNVSNVIELPLSVIIIVSMFYVISCYTNNYCCCMLLKVYKFCYAYCWLTLTNAECNILLSLMSNSYKELEKHKYNYTNEKDGAGNNYC